MTLSTIVDLQLEALYGYGLPTKIQKLIDHEMNLGHWVEGYELAAFPDEVDEPNARKLLEIVLEQDPALRIDGSTLSRLVEELLPESRVLWIVHEDGSYALTDGLRVARFLGASLIWRTPRISIDGIVFGSLKDGKLRGLAWQGESWDDSPDDPFTIDFETGEILEGQIVRF